MRFAAKVCSALLLLPMIAGCGSGGGGSNGRATPAAVYVTDLPREDYDHVYITILKVELLDSSGAATVIFDDPAGKVIDLRQLHDATGKRFAFLTGATVPPGNYTQFRVTIGSSIGLVPRGTTSVQTVQVDNTVITRPLGPARAMGHGSDDDVVLDFDLTGFSFLNGLIHPELHESDHAGLHEHGRHQRNLHSGVVSDLAGSNAAGFTFTLSHGSRESITVVTNSSTQISNDNGTPNPTLQNGSHVEVTGTFDPDARVLRASSVRIETEDQNEAEVGGPPSGINATAGTFVVTAARVEDFVPTSTTVNVAVTGSTVFRSAAGLAMTQAAFFTALATATSVEVEGIYSASTNTITATRVRLDTGHD